LHAWRKLKCVGRNLPTRDLSQSLNRDADAKFSNLLRRVPGKADEADLGNETVLHAGARLMRTASLAIRL
jgi:hypothetical protein